MNLLLG